MSSNQMEMQDVRNDSMSIEIKQERVEYDTKFLHVENENTLLRKKLEESMNLQKVLTEKLASSVIKIQQIQGEKKEAIAKFTKSEVEKDKLRGIGISTYIEACGGGGAEEGRGVSGTMGISRCGRVHRVGGAQVEFWSISCAVPAH